MKHAIFAGCLAVMMLLSLSLLLLRPTAGPEEKPPSTAAVHEKPAMVQENVKEEHYDREHAIVMLQGTQKKTLGLRDYLIGVVLAEMPASFSPAALEAQAVASRTFILRQSQKSKHEGANVCDSGGCCQEYTDKDKLREEMRTADYQRVCAAVDQTDGLVLRYKGALIDATYFSCSGGKTEAAAAVWGGEVPYLQPVDSPGEEASKRYTDRVCIPAETFKAAILEAAPMAELTGTSAGWFGAVTPTAGGGVADMEIGGASFQGTQLRSLFGLRSTNFTVCIEGEEIVFETYGYGHRVGMSQYGAQAMAEAGSDFREILTHYYTGVTIEPVS